MTTNLTRLRTRSKDWAIRHLKDGRELASGSLEGDLLAQIVHALNHLHVPVEEVKLYCNPRIFEDFTAAAVQAAIVGCAKLELLKCHATDDLRLEPVIREADCIP